MKHPSFLGLETGGTKYVASLCDAAGHVLVSRMELRSPTATAPQTLRSLIDVGRQVCEEAGPDHALQAVGLGFGGTVHRDTNRPMLNLHEAGWESVDAAAEISAAFSRPVFCENDCKVAALAEAWLGAGTRNGVSLYLTAGSGIGGGIIYDGRVLACSPWGEGEVGHFVMDPSGPPCGCGNRGCLEALCSGWGLAQRARVHAQDLGAVSRLASQLPDLAENEITRVVFSAYPDDPLAVRCVEEFCATLGRACSYLVNLLTPHVIVLGGGVFQSAWLVPRVAAAARAHIAPHLRQPVRFAASQLGERAVSVGAALYARQHASPSASFSP